jgi:hypothetical protein
LLVAPQSAPLAHAPLCLLPSEVFPPSD